MTEGGADRSMPETERVQMQSRLYSRHSRVSERFKAFQDTTVDTPNMYIRHSWTEHIRFQTQQRVWSTLWRNSETESAKRTQQPNKSSLSVVNIGRWTDRFLEQAATSTVTMSTRKGKKPYTERSRRESPRHIDVIFKGNVGWTRPMLVGPRGMVMGPCIVEINCIVIREFQYQLEVNRCRNEEVNFQGSSANSVGGDSGQDGRMDRRRR
ncbi:hypothetical protein DPMN_192618 [Dreissena polymorpha]|uniref:Uncharacterized protein n=1 Tax=Dreissena polymorpha TaxID=45954 RepID=A0A9D3Y6M8_DREPO|nr:hypothetical protein DPMN_192618 [Dreissena polymorpha]